MRYNPYTKNLKVRVFDIETTGLYPQQDRIISASFVNTDGNNLKQFFLDAPQTEDILITQILDELSKCDVVITYNGDRFDLPFILQRAKKNHVASALPMFWSIDIYKYLKNYWPNAKSMQSLRQKAVEFALGLTERTDEIDGGECIPLYAEYVNWNSEEAKEKILLHNADDVRQLARITQKLSFLPYHQIAFERGFKVKDYVITDIKMLKTKISVSAIGPKGLTPTDIYEDGYHLEYESDTGHLMLDIFTQTKEDFVFVDLTKLIGYPIDFADMQGYKSGYLILKYKDEILYKEVNTLIKRLI